VNPLSEITRSTPVQLRIQPYVRNMELFRHPVTNELYRFNLSLSYKNESSIERIAEIAMVYEGSPAPDGTRGVAFTDGHVQRVTADEWEQIKKVSGVTGSNRLPPLPKPLTISEQLRGTHASSALNLKQLGLGLMQYVQDYDEKLPPMRPATSVAQIRGESAGRATINSTTSVFTRLLPYLKSVAIFRHPVTGEIYRPNQTLSGRPVTSVKRPAEVVAFYEGSAAADGTRGITYLDGHVGRIREIDWPHVARRSGIKIRTKPAAGNKRALPAVRGSTRRLLSNRARPHR
jgi:hypothetical protein